MGRQCRAQLFDITRITDVTVLVAGAVVLVVHIADYIDMLVSPGCTLPGYYRAQVGHVDRARGNPLGRLYLNLPRLDVVHLIAQAISHGIARHQVQTEHGESQRSGYRVGPGYMFGKTNGDAGSRNQTYPHHIYLPRVGQMCHVKPGGPLPGVVRIAHQHATTALGQRATKSQGVAAKHVAINF